MTDISSTNKERTTEYLSKFNREKVLKYLILILEQMMGFP